MPELVLSDKEKQLRRLLLDVAKFIDSTSQNTEPIILRWAGGWVRDKLLGYPSNDIDVAINIMTGMQFAERVRDYCILPEAIKLHGIQKEDIGSLHSVASNPEKSKHLETAMVKIFDLDLDFVNLRKETYAEDSRTPQMEFGTAEEDALRRDATINALFYNLHDHTIEDFTGGVPDMEAKLVRTPLEPLQTFADDPLRVLRLVRFASRLRFSIDPEAERVMGDENVLEALRVKISRERVGIELEKMLKGNHPRDALRFIERLNLYHAIFTNPAHPPIKLPLLPRWSVAYECLNTLIRNQTPNCINKLLIRTSDAEHIAWNLVATSPWMPIEEGVTKKTSPIEEVAREGFKAPNRLTEVIAAARRNRKEIVEMKIGVNNNEPWVNERDTVGMKIRRWEGRNLSWRLQVLSALLVDAMEQLDEWETSASPGTHPLQLFTNITNSNLEQDTFLQGWQFFLDHLLELDVYDAPFLKGLLDGKKLSKALGWAPGQWMGKALEICTEWQLRHPNAADPAGAIEEVRKRKVELPHHENIKILKVK